MHAKPLFSPRDDFCLRLNKLPPLRDFINWRGNGDREDNIMNMIYLSVVVNKQVKSL